jgi:hypothetical protein
MGAHTFILSRPVACGNAPAKVFSPPCRMKRSLFILALIVCRVGLCRAAAEAWDSAHFIHVSEVKPGMVGYGLSVFSGTRIDKFNVEVVDVVKNMVNPKCDAILINCKDERLDHQGPVEGMSGSPIYLYDLDDTQHLHPRLAGAYAYGFEWQTQPLAGVQPIEYMLNLPPTASSSETQRTVTDGTARPHWTLADAPALPGFTRNGAGFRVTSDRQETWRSGDGPGLRMLATPLMASGLSGAAARSLAPLFADCGLDLQDGAAAGATAPPPDIRMEPGSVLVIPLLAGDMELSASGTCTLVRGNRVLAFGHEFNNEGPIHLPMSTGTVSTIIQNLHASFKLASMAQICGSLTDDQSMGVAGTLGMTPPMIPITLHVHYADGSLDQTYNFTAALHPTFTPLAAIAATSLAITGLKNLPAHHTIDSDLKLEFADGRTIHIANRDADGQVQDIAQALGLPILVAGDNPFQSVPLKRMTGNIVVRDGAELARLTSVTLPKLKYEPGVTVTAYANYRTWRGGEGTLPIQCSLPRDLPDGPYQLVVSGWERYFADELDAEPFRFSAENINEMFDVLAEYEGVRHNALYVRLVRQEDGVAVGRQAMPRLPYSMRQALLESGRSDLEPFVSSEVETIPTDLVMDGAADFTLTIERQAVLPKPATQP